MFLEAYAFARRPKTLQGLAPFAFVSRQWTSGPERFSLHPDHPIPGPNGYLAVLAAAALRVASAFAPNAPTLLTLSGALWILAFAGFALAFAPLLIGRRPQLR